MVANTAASTRCAYPERDGQAELAWVAGLNTKTMITHLSTKWAQHIVTLPMSAMPLPHFSQ